jgi:hypothetical protein
MKVDSVTFIEAFCNKCKRATPGCSHYGVLCKYNPSAAGMSIMSTKNFTDVKPECPSMPVRIAQDGQAIHLYGEHDAITVMRPADRLERVKLDGHQYLTHVDSSGKRTFVTLEK